MDSDRLNRWLTLGANLGVLVGIIFLAAEIRQNSDLARLQFAEDRQTTWQQGELVVFGDSIATVWEKSVLNPVACLRLGQRSSTYNPTWSFSSTLNLQRLGGRSRVGRGNPS